MNRFKAANKVNLECRKVNLGSKLRVISNFFYLTFVSFFATESLASNLDFSDFSCSFQNTPYQYSDVLPGKNVSVTIKIKNNSGYILGPTTIDGTEVSAAIYINDEKQLDSSGNNILSIAPYGSRSYVFNFTSPNGFQENHTHDIRVQLWIANYDTEPRLCDEDIVITTKANSAPILTSTNPPDPIIVDEGKSFDLNLSATDVDENLWKIEVNYNDGTTPAAQDVSGGSGTKTFSYSYPSSRTTPYKVTANAYDKTNAISNTLEWQVTVQQNVAPTLRMISDPPSEVDVGNSVSISLSASDSNNNLKKIAVNWNDPDITDGSDIKEQNAAQNETKTFSYTYRSVSYSPIKITANAYDTEDLPSATLEWTINVIEPTPEPTNSAPSLLTSTPQNQTVVAGTEATIILSATDPDNNLSRIDVDWNDHYKSGEEVESEYDFEDVSFTYTYETPDDEPYRVTARAYDEHEAESNEGVFYITVTAPDQDGAATSPIPNSGVSLNELPLELSWNQSGSPNSFDVYIQSPSQSSPTLVCGNIQDTNCALNMESVWGAYTWYVISNFDGVSYTSDTWSFTLVDANAPNIEVRQTLASMYTHSCAIKDSRVFCWGDESDGATIVPDLIGEPIKVDVGYRFSCVLTTVKVQCWGDNAEGQTSVPEDLTNPTDIAVGNSHACAIGDKGVQCWGNAADGKTRTPTNINNPIRIGAGSWNTCVIDGNRVRCWGENGFGINSPPSNISAPKSIAMGEGHACVINGNNSLVCWGLDQYGQVSHASGANSVINLGVGRYHTCALMNGQVSCWGDNNFGQRDVPSDLGTVLEVSGGGEFSCVWTVDEVKCWGANNLGQTDISPELQGDADPTIQFIGDYSEEVFNNAREIKILAQDAESLRRISFYIYDRDNVQAAAEIHSEADDTVLGLTSVEKTWVIPEHKLIHGKRYVAMFFVSDREGQDNPPSEDFNFTYIDAPELILLTPPQDAYIYSDFLFQAELDRNIEPGYFVKIAFQHNGNFLDWEDMTCIASTCKLERTIIVAGENRNFKVGIFESGKQQPFQELSGSYTSLELPPEEQPIISDVQINGVSNRSVYEGSAHEVVITGERLPPSLFITINGQSCSRTSWSETVVTFSCEFSGTGTFDIEILGMQHGDPVNGSQVDDEWAFEVEVQHRFSNLSPENASRQIYSSASTTFSWESQSGATGYNLFLDGEQLNENLIFGTSFNYTAPIAVGVHSWVVEAKLGDGTSVMSFSSWFEALSPQVPEPPEPVTSPIDNDQTQQDEEIKKDISTGDDPKVSDGADPVGLAYGNYYSSKTVFCSPKIGDDICFTLNYDTLNNDEQSSLGYGWQHNWQQKLIEQADGTALVQRSNGHVQHFVLSGDNEYQAALGEYTTNELSKEDNAFVFTTKSRYTYRFIPSEFGIANEYQLASITDKFGNVTTVSHEVCGVSAIKDAEYQADIDLLSFEYDSNCNLQKVSTTGERYVELVVDDNANLVTYTDPEGYSTTYTYDEYHRVETATDPLGNVFITNTYDERGRVVKQLDPEGEETTFIYSDSPRKTTLINRLGKKQEYFYDINYREIKTRDELGFETLTAYDQNSNVVSRTDKRGYTTLFEYDDRNNLIKITDPLGGERKFTYDSDDNLETITNELGGVETRTYDSLGNLETVTDPQGNVTTHTYNDFGQPRTTKYPNNGMTSYEYSPITGLLIQETDPRNTITTFEYHDDGQVKTLKNLSRNYEYTFTYDKKGQKKTEVDPLNQSQSWEYDGNGNEVKHTSKGGIVTISTYNKHAYITRREEEGYGRWTEWEYDKENRITKVKNQAGRYTAYEYDDAGRQIVVNDNGRKTTSTLNANGQALTITNPVNETRSVQYDALGRVVAEINPDGTLKQFIRNAMGLVKKIIDERGITVKEIEYNTSGQKTLEKDAYGNKTKYEYNSMGLLAVTTNASEHTTKYFYDLNNNLWQVEDAAGGLTTYTYDEDNNNTSITDAGGTVTTFAYDLLNRLESETDSFGNTKTYTYNALDQRLTETNENGQTTTYDYTDDFLLSTVTEPEGAYTYGYNNNDEILSIDGYKGTHTIVRDDLGRIKSTNDIKGFTNEYTYDDADRVLTVTFDDKTVTQTFNQNGQLATVEDWDGKVTTYSYSVSGKLVSAAISDISETIRAYDGNDRLIQITNFTKNSIVSVFKLERNEIGLVVSVDTSKDPYQPYPFELISNTQSFEYTSNQLTLDNDSTQGFDANGNRVFGTINNLPVELGFDSQNRLATTSFNTSYRYDYFGNRIAKTVDGKTVKYRVDQVSGSYSRVLQEIDEDSNNAIASYVYGIGLTSRYRGEADERTVSTLPYAAYQFDHNGNTVGLITRRGTINADYLYSPFGQQLKGYSNIASPFTFSGLYGVMDEGNGLYFMRSRYYSANERQFLSKDSYLGDFLRPSSLNRYAYVEGNPISYVDPTGYSKQEASDDRDCQFNDELRACLDSEGRIVWEDRVTDISWDVAAWLVKIKEAKSVYQLLFSKKATPALPDSYWIKRRAPLQISPGKRVINDYAKPSSKGGTYHSTSHYDEFGRSIGQTHRTNHGRPNDHPNLHHHRRDPITGEKLKTNDGSSVWPGPFGF